MSETAYLNLYTREQLAERCARFERENARLREVYCSMSHEVSQLTSDYSESLFARDRLRAMNARLRRAVQALAFCANDRADCDRCPMNGAEPGPVVQAFCDGMAELLGELGVEVDG